MWQTHQFPQLKRTLTMKIQVCVWGQLRGPPQRMSKAIFEHELSRIHALLSWPLKEVLKRNHKVGLSFTIPT